MKLQWEQRYVGRGLDYPVAAAPSPDGARLFVAGVTWRSDTGYDYLTLAHDARTGDVLWTARYGTSLTNYFGDYATALAVSPDGRTVFVTGRCPIVGTGSGHGYDYCTLAYDALDGSEVWRSFHATPVHDTATAMAVTPDGTAVFITGHSLLDDVTVAYDAATGSEIWKVTVEPPGHLRADALALSPDGTVVFVTGSWTVAYDAMNGGILWSRPGSSAESSLVVSPDGRTLFVAGTSIDAYDAATGAHAWQGSHALVSLRLSSISISRDGKRVFATGSSIGDGTARDYATLAYNTATGEKIWSAPYDRPGDDQAASLVVSPSGDEVVVTGSSVGGVHARDYATLGYDARTGEELWSARYDGPARHEDIVTALAMSPDGSAAYVSGYSKGVGTDYDTATLAYELVLRVNIGMVPVDPSNVITSCSRAPVSVAIFGDEGFDVRAVDAGTLRFGPGGATAEHDLADAFTYKQHIVDVNLDGYPDLVAHFSIETAGIVPGLETVRLTGATAEGRKMEGKISIVVHDCL